ncbi:ECF transporter S component family protein [Serinibacter arcticus]|uniref:Substrate-specific component CbrT of predicted cobalamin ECF transporter n=1 Tax=Serinibacter arcticus TaxID=1655435 RepID=A0A4Z1E440_9MICO|nr:ECF transporter S component [Serinibacter arcticus]TGO06040.1 Substrate-specific component CbrT of predicted cobalamin ECF transporter [Serinibacter arcticus]
MTRAQRALLLVANLVAAAAFAWPLIVPAVPSQAQAAAPWAALALVPIAVVLVLIALDASIRSATTLAMLGTLTAVGAAVRIAGTGVGGVEAVFVVLILAGRAFGARFGFLLGVLVIALSSIASGFGPWTPFQMVACAWVGAGAGLLPGARPRGSAPRRERGARWREVALLASYGVVASYAFGAVMNLWFWPFAVGPATSISYSPNASLGTNLGSFLSYTLVTSTLTWDTIRAVTSVVGIAVAGPAVLAALRRAKVRPESTSETPRSTSRTPESTSRTR